MASKWPAWLLQAYLLLMLFRPLSQSSHPERVMRISAPPPEELEEQDMDTAPVPLWAMVLVSLGGLLLELLVTAIILRCCFHKRIWKSWGEKKQQSLSVSPKPRCCKGHGCPKELLQLLKHNRDLMLLCLQYSLLKRARQKTPAKYGIWKRRRLCFSLRL